MNPLWQYDLSLKNDIYDYVIGSDETGRGSLASCIVGCSIVLSPEAANLKINDSKKLSEKSREALYDKILENSIAYSIELLSANYIDAHGIQLANKNVLFRSRDNVLAKLPEEASVISIVDGNPLWTDDDLMWVHQADSKSLTVAAASIIAKVFRDRLMRELDDEYPEYLFHQHKGYGTAIHKEAIKKYGKIQDIHRLSFTKDLPNDKIKY